MNDNSSQRWTGHYLGVAHRFVPAALQQDAALNARASNLVNAAVCAGTAGPLHALACWLLGLRTAAVEILLCCVAMLVALFFNFTWLGWHLGGIAAPTVSRLITGPTAAMFLGGKRCAGVWLELSRPSATLIHGLQAHGVAQPPGSRAP